MKAIGYWAAGPIDRDDALVDLDLPAPTPGPRDLLVRIAAISVNPVDAKIRANAPPPQGAPRILGFDAAGTVESVGAEVTLFQPGDAVYYAGDVNRPGSCAELHLVDERLVGRKPASLDWAQAAALPLTAITAWEILFDRLRVPMGQEEGGSLLILNGAGGVGSILIQLARRLTGLTVIASASRAETRAWVTDLGAHHVIDHSRPLEGELQRIGFSQVDLVANLTDSESVLSSLPGIIAPRGVVAMITAPKALDAASFMRKSVTIAFELIFTRPTFGGEDMIAQHEILEQVARLVDAGVLRTTLTSTIQTLDAASLREAHRTVEGGRSIGKTVLLGF